MPARTITRFPALVSPAVLLAVTLLLAACGGTSDVATGDPAEPAATAAPDSAAGSGGAAGAGSAAGTPAVAPTEPSADPTATTAEPTAPTTEPADATPSPAPASPTATPVGEGEELDCAWPGNPIVSGGFPNYSSNDGLLVDARLAGQGSYDRFVLELTGDAGAPTDSYVISWTATPPAAEGSGEPVAPAGDWYLEIRATASLYDFVTDTPYGGPTSVFGDTDNVQQALSGGSFEGYMLWVLGADDPKGFRVQEISDPSRLVIDVCVGGIDWPPAPVDALCGEADPLPGDAVVGTTVAIDMDGDGTDEEASTWFSPSESAWHIRVVTPISSFDELIADSDAVFESRPLGGVQMNGIGGDELFVRTGGGAATQAVGVYTLAGCDLVRTTLAGSGAPASWLEGATVSNVSAFECDPAEGTITQRFASIAGFDDDGAPIGWNVTADVLGLSGAEWTPQPGPPDFGSPGATPPFSADVVCAYS